MRVYRFAKVIGQEADIVYVMVMDRVLPRQKQRAVVIDSFGPVGGGNNLSIERGRQLAAEIIRSCRKQRYYFTRID